MRDFPQVSPTAIKNSMRSSSSKMSWAKVFDLEEEDSSEGWGRKSQL